MAQTRGNWHSNLAVTSLSDVGMRRAINQDSLAVVEATDPSNWSARGHLFIVADGMGAHVAGELASKLAVDHIPHLFYKLAQLPAPQALHQAIFEANRIIHGRGQADSEFHGMGTTCSSLLLLPQGAVCGHVGDSRVYRLRQQTLEQLSADHSLVWEMMAAGQLADDEVPSYVPKNVITRSLGPNPEVQVDIEGPFPVEVGDVYLLCSDGLTGPVSNEEIGVLLDCLPVDEAAQTLIDLANLRGGPDNITAVIVRVQEEPVAHETPAAPPAHRPSVSENSTLWALIGGCVLVAIVLAVLGHLAWAVVGLGIGVAILGIHFLLRMDKATPATEITPLGGPFGQGPYRSYACEANIALVGQFAEVIASLRSAAQQEEWAVDCQAFEQHASTASKATAAEDYREAIAQYAAAIRSMMSELRKVGGRPA